MYSIRVKALEPGMMPCRHCKNDGKRAYTEFGRGWPNDAGKTWLNTPPLYFINHWCDVGGPDGEWGDLKRYTHGHGALNGNIKIKYYSSKDEAIAAWNARMTPVVSSPLSFIKRWFKWN